MKDEDYYLCLRHYYEKLVLVEIRQAAMQMVTVTVTLMLNPIRIFPLQSEST